MLLVNIVDTKIIDSLKINDKYLDKTFLSRRDHDEDGYGLTIYLTQL